MSSRASSSNLAGPSANSTSKRFANRRQERVRGAGKHEIIPGKYNFGHNSFQRRSSSIISSASTPVQRQSSTQSTSISSTPHQSGNRNRNGRELLSTPAMSLQSGRGGEVPSSSPSKYIDPRLLADQSHQLNSNGAALLKPSPSAYDRLIRNTIEQRRLERLRGAGTHQIEPRSIQFGKGRESDEPSSDSGGHLIGKTIDQRRLERLRGAGTHQIEPRYIQFGKARASDAPSSDSGRDTGTLPGLLDRFMDSLSQSNLDVGGPKNVKGKVDWIEQRRLERRRGAGAHAIEETKATFGPLSRRSNTPSSILGSGSIIEENDQDEQGNHTISRNFSPPSESTPRGLNGQTRQFGSFDISNGQEHDGIDFDDNQSHATMPSPGSMAAQRIMEKRKSKRQGSPFRDAIRKTKSNRHVGKGPPRRLKNLGMFNEADETVAGQADETLQEQREAAFTAPQPPSWTFPKNPVTKEELSEMKSRVQEMVTLALGNEAGAFRTIKVNDADVLWSVLKKELHLAIQQHRPSSTITIFLNQLSDSLLTTFTLLSQQSAERAQLINHLIQARRKNLHIRKEVFQKRSQVLKVARSMQILKRQEIKRLQQEEEEQRSLHFLSQLQRASHEWS